MKKRMISLLLAVGMTLLMVVPAAAQEEMRYELEKVFCGWLEEMGVTYTIKENGSYDDVRLEINLGDYECVVHNFFSPGDERIDIRIYDLINYEEADEMEVFRVVDEQNSLYNYGGFYLDEQWDSVCLRLSTFVLPGEDAADIMGEAFARAVNIARDGEAAFADYAS